MQKYLNLDIVDNLLEMLGLRTKNSLLSLFDLDPNLRTEIDTLDVSQQSFSADMFYDFFNALLRKKMQIASVNYQIIIPNSAPIDIYAMHPNSSRADNYIASSLVLDNRVAKPDVNFEIAKDIHLTQQMLTQAIKILHDYKESGLQTNLLNSIAIYAGAYPIPTSCSTLLCQGRFFALNVGKKYPLFYYIDMIVHEVAHQYLQIINYFEPLSIDTNKKFLSASNNKLRPVYGIINSAFVLYRLIIFYQSAKELLCSIEQEADPKDAYAYLQTRFFEIPFNYTLRLEVYKLKLKHSLEQLEISKALTPKGLELVELMLRVC